MHETFLIIHSLVRWVIVAGAVGIVVGFARGFAGGKQWSASDNRWAAVFTHGMSLQFVIGLILYFWISPITTGVFADFGAAMKDRILRFWAVEHFVTMFIALALAHIGSARVRKAAPEAKLKAAAIFFGIAIVLVLASIPWTFLSYGRPLFRF